VEIKRLKDLERFSAETMAKVNLFETPRFFLDIYCLEPGQEQKVHAHTRNDKVYCAVRGAVKAIVGAETCELREGECVLAKAGEPHGVKNDSGERAVLLVLMAPHPSSGS